MLNLELLVLPLDLAQRLQLGGNDRVHIYALGHDDPLSREFSPTRQHERMDVKRLGDIAAQDVGLLVQSNRGGLEFVAVTAGGFWAWLCIGGTPEG